MRKELSIIIFLLFSCQTFAQIFKGQIDSGKVPAPAFHYLEEYNFDTTVNPAAWKSQAKGLHSSFVSTDQLYFRSEVPKIEVVTKSWGVTGWKGERLNAQLLVWSPD